MVTNYNVQYNIPRIQIQMPGRQNRLTDGEFRISPSMTEPVKFIFGNQDGVPLSLAGFRINFVVWEHSLTQFDTLGIGQSQILINKQILIDDPHSGEINMVLSEDDTIKIGYHAPGQTLNWSLFMVNEDGDVFPTQVSNSGGRYGTLIVDLASGMPIAEMIRSPLG